MISEGSPYDPDSLGCYAPVIERALRRVLAERGEETAWCVEDLTGLPLERICTDYLDRGRPVIFWACIDMKEPATGPVWYLEDGETRFSWTSNEHCMLLDGAAAALHLLWTEKWNLDDGSGIM